MMSKRIIQNRHQLVTWARKSRCQQSKTAASQTFKNANLNRSKNLGLWHLQSNSRSQMTFLWNKQGIQKRGKIPGRPLWLLLSLYRFHMEVNLPKFTSSIFQISKNWLTQEKVRAGDALRQPLWLGIDQLEVKDLDYRSKAKFLKILDFKPACKP